MKIWELLDRPVVIHRPLIDLGLGLTGALMLSQALYWTKHTRESAEGWIYKTIEDWQRETGLTRTEQANARKRLCAAGFIEEKRAGILGKMHYRVKTDALSDALLNLLSSSHETRKQDDAKHANKSAGNVQTECGNAANKSAGKLQTNISKTTTGTTTGTTTVVAAAKKQRPARKSPGLSVKQPADTSPILIDLPDGRQVELPGDLSYPRDPQSKSFKVWCNYAVCYHRHYGVWPAWNAKQARQCTELVSRVGADLAPRLAAYFLKDRSDAYVMRTGHQLTTLAAQAEIWLARMQGAQLGTKAQAEHESKARGTADAVSEAIAQRRARHAE